LKKCPEERSLSDEAVMKEIHNRGYVGQREVRTGTSKSILEMEIQGIVVQAEVHLGGEGQTEKKEFSKKRRGVAHRGRGLNVKTTHSQE